MSTLQSRSKGGIGGLHSGLLLFKGSDDAALLG